MVETQCKFKWQVKVKSQRPKAKMTNQNAGVRRFVEIGGDTLQPQMTIDPPRSSSLPPGERE